MKEIYEKLNRYLNDICLYLEDNDTFFLQNLSSIAVLNDAVFAVLNSFECDEKIKTNHLTFEDVYLLSREIIESIDKTYLKSYDALIENGELDFDFDGILYDSECVCTYFKDNVKKIINLKRAFNYNDVISLVHEFIHYTHGDYFSKNHHYFSEFLSIYFELYAVNYLLKKGIPVDEISAFGRFTIIKKQSILLNRYEIVLLAYKNFGISENVISYLNEYELKINQETFHKECLFLYDSLCSIEKKFQKEISHDPQSLGFYLSDEFIAHNYRYILGTLLAVYVHRYGNMKDVVYLNNHLQDYQEKNLEEICSLVGLSLKDTHVKEKLLIALKGYLRDQKKLVKKLKKNDK